MQPFARLYQLCLESAPTLSPTDNGIITFAQSGVTVQDSKYSVVFEKKLHWRGVFVQNGELFIIAILAYFVEHKLMCQNCHYVLRHTKAESKKNHTLSKDLIYEGFFLKLLFSGPKILLIKPLNCTATITNFVGLKIHSKVFFFTTFSSGKRDLLLNWIRKVFF